MGKILYVEPDPQLNQTVSEILKRAGFQVDSYLDPHQAVTAARAQRYDLLITEYKMPFKGTMLIRQVFDIQLIPVIITAVSPAEVLDDTLARLPIAPRLLKKPFETWELMDEIDKALLRVQ